MPGTRSNAFPVHAVVSSFNAGAVTAALTLTEYVCLFPGRIGAIKANAQTAGVGAGNGVLDVLLNGTSIWTTAGNRPTLLGTATGEFANTAPDSRAVQPGDRLLLQSATIPATTGHARLMFSVAIEGS